MDATPAEPEEAAKRPRFFNDRISKAKLLETAKRVRVAADDWAIHRATRNERTASNGVMNLLLQELAQPGMREVGLILSGVAVILSAVLALHAYDLYRGGDGLVALNLLADRLSTWV